jgi:sortase A
LKLRSLARSGSVFLIAVGVAISFSSLKAIEESSAGNQFVPALGSFNSSSSLNSSAKTARGAFIGTLEIARLKKTIPIYQGTEAAQLKKGAGHYEKSVMPGVKDNSVIAGHRDTVFSKFGNLKIGDPLIVTTKSGRFEYKIESFRIVKANDRTVIVSTKDARLTLSTCYPFYFIGNAPKRFIVSASLIQS